MQSKPHLGCTALHKAGGGIGRPTCAKVACNEC